jgi:HEAT repeat protein
MDLQQIETDLQNPDFQYRLKAIAALKAYPSEVAVPILSRYLHDSEFLVRSFVAMGLGKQQIDKSFALLLQIMKFDNTPNVRAEAANSLSLFGRISASHLVQTFVQDDHWLVRRSILAALVELECAEEVLEVCLEALKGEDQPVRETAVDALGSLVGTRQQAAALSHLLTLKDAESDRIRVRVAYALKHFDHPAARAALVELRQDSSHQVIGAALEDLVP